MRQKVFRAGDSLAVKLPPEARQLGIDVGHEVDVLIREGTIVVHGLRQDLFEWVDAFIERNRDLLERLAE